MDVYFSLPHARKSALNEVIQQTQLQAFNDAGVSGMTKIVCFIHGGNLYYTKVYLTISAEVGGSVDNVGDNLYTIDDAGLSGTPVVFGLTSGGVEYYFKAYPTAAVGIYFDGDRLLQLTKYADAALSGTPRVAKVVVGGTAYYWKIYPTKS